MSEPAVMDDAALPRKPLLLYSPLLKEVGVPHAFSTRIGGVSRGVFSSLNFGNPGDIAPSARDCKANIVANQQLVLAEIDAVGREVVEVHQVHGADILTLSRGTPAHRCTETTKADALVAADAARMLSVRVADCVPVLLASRDGHFVGAVHAGWRGVIAGVAARAVEAMRQMGAANIFAAIGPCITAPSFEIGPEVVAAFRIAFGPQTPHVAQRPDGKGNADMKNALREQLSRAGVGNIDILPHCTVGDATLFFSHRRDRGVTGRMMAIIGPRA